MLLHLLDRLADDKRRSEPEHDGLDGALDDVTEQSASAHLAPRRPFRAPRSPILDQLDGEARSPRAEVDRSRAVAGVGGQVPGVHPVSLEKDHRILFRPDIDLDHRHRSRGTAGSVPPAAPDRAAVTGRAAASARDRCPPGRQRSHPWPLAARSPARREGHERARLPGRRRSQARRLGHLHWRRRWAAYGSPSWLDRGSLTVTVEAGPPPLIQNRRERRAENRLRVTGVRRQPRGNRTGAGSRCTSPRRVTCPSRSGHTRPHPPLPWSPLVFQPFSRG